MKRDPWTVLGIRPGANAEEVRDAWRRQVSHWHPDRNNSPEATVRLQQANDAYVSVKRGTFDSVDVPLTQPVLAGLSGTVFGILCRPADNITPHCACAELEIPAISWATDAPVTLTIPLPLRATAIVTLLHPRQFRDGSVIVFPGAGRAANGAAVDLAVTIRVAARGIQAPAWRTLERVRRAT